MMAGYRWLLVRSSAALLICLLSWEKGGRTEAAIVSLTSTCRHSHDSALTPGRGGGGGGRRGGRGRRGERRRKRGEGGGGEEIITD